MPTAAAADAGGGLAALEVVCRVLVLQDCQPAVASPGLVQALKKGTMPDYDILMLYPYFAGCVCCVSVQYILHVKAMTTRNAVTVLCSMPTLCVGSSMHLPSCAQEVLVKQ